MSSPIASGNLVFRRSRRMALADGVLIDATQGGWPRFPANTSRTTRSP